MDTISRKERSRIMSLVKSKNTKPEVIVRKLVSSLGYRYRLHVKNLPGKPDIVFKAKMKIIFVQGCFWHRHKHCSLSRLPKSNLRFWFSKLESNQKRDRSVKRSLKKLGWDVFYVWQCELSDLQTL